MSENKPLTSDQAEPEEVQNANRILPDGTLLTLKNYELVSHKAANELLGELKRAGFKVRKKFEAKKGKTSLGFRVYYA